MTLAVQQQRFIFSSDPVNPYDLIMFENKQAIVKLMFEQRSRTFVWIVGNSCEFAISSQIRTMKLDIHFCTNLMQALTYISKNKNKNNKQKREFILIGCFEHLQQYELIFRNQQITKTICYDTSQSQYLLYLKLQQVYDQNSKKLFIAEDQQELISVLANLNQKSSDFKMLPNFISMQDDAWNSNILIKTMQAMLNQSLNEQLRRKLIVQLVALFSQICKQNSYFVQQETIINKFIQEMLKGQLSINRAIYWFSLQSPIFKITNNLLRVARHPAQIYYIQPFFKDLFNSIRSLYQQQKLKFKNKPQICYRGGSMQNSQINFFLNNVGHTIQNLGFLSTSLNRDMALEYAVNVIFTIIIPKLQDRPDIQYGYAWIANLSEYYSQQQILFNPLNSFRILEVIQVFNKGVRKIQVKLEYGAVSSIMSKSVESLSQNDKWLSWLFKHQKKEMSKIRRQADTFLVKLQSLDGAIQFFNQIFKLCQSDQKVIIQALIMRGKCLYLQGQFQDSIEDFNKCNILIQNYPQINKNQILKSTVMMHLCKIYCKMGHHTKAINMQQYLRDFMQQEQNSQQKQELCIEWLFSLGESYEGNGHFQKSNEIYQQIESRMLKCYGKYHPEYARLMFKIAQTNNSMFHYDRVLNLYEQYTKVNLKIKGQSSVEYVDVLFKTALIYKNINELTNAQNLLHRCYCILSSLKTQSILFYNVLHHLGVVSCCLGKVASAFSYCKKSLQGFAKKLGCQNQNYAAALNGIGIVYQRLNNFKQAHYFFEQSLKIFSVNKQSKSIYTALLLLDIGKNYAFQKKHKQALQNFYKSQKQFQRCSSTECRQYALLMQLTAAAQYYYRNYMKSQQYFKKSLQLYFRIDGSNHANYGRIFLRMLPLLIDMTEDEDKTNTLLVQSDHYTEFLQHKNAHKANNLQKVSVLYRNRGNYLRNLRLINQAIQLYCSNSLKQQEAFLFMQIQKAITFYSNEQYRKSRNIIIKVYRIYSQQKDQVTVQSRFNFQRTRIYLQRVTNKILNKISKQRKYEDISFIDFS